MTSALRLESVRCVLRGQVVLDGLSLDVVPGECRAIVGLNGAGKTTALRVMLEMLRPDAGHVHVLGQRLPCADRRVWRGVGHLVEMPFSYPELTARQNIRASSALHAARPKESDRRMGELADALRFADHLDVPVRRLSLGTRQKVGLAAAMAHEPRLLILDEPTNGLDPLAVVGLRDLITQTTGSGAAVVVTSHHFDELARLADQVDVLHHGTIIESLTPDGPDLERRFFDTILAADTVLAAGTGEAP